ncbi:MAG: signal peptide peptidase SppA [Verrucomicrobiota bacterium]
MTFLLAFALMMVVGSSLLEMVNGFGVQPPSRHSHGRWLEELVIEENHSDNKIAIVDIDGVIMSGSIDGSGLDLVKLIKDQLKRAEDDKRVKAVVLKVDSPGGEVLASDEIYRAIQEFQEDTGKPVVASMSSVAASGGYYVSAPCQWIVANELTITGSIGVIMHSYNYRGLMNKVGVRPQVFKSGKFKDMLSGDKELEEILPEEKEMVQGLINETFTRFKKVVADGRKYANTKNKGKGRALVSDWEEYADGRILSGRQAHEHGFVDELGNFDTAVGRAMELANIGDADLVGFRPPFTLGNIFRIFGKSEAASIKVDLGVDLPRIQAGRLYFLSPTLIY